MFYQLAEAGLEPPQDSTRKTANSKEGGAKSGAAGAGQAQNPILAELIAVWPNVPQAAREAVLATVRAMRKQVSG